MLDNLNKSVYQSVYMMGIGGIAMGTLATMLRERGFHVVGSDQNLYPPMSTHLERLHIPLCRGYDPEHLKQCQPELVVIGNVIRRDNPQAQYVMDHGIPYVSMVDAIDRFFLSDHDSIVVTGTHGKSTTTALLAWVLEVAGLDPSALLGGFAKNWHKGYRLGQGRYMVLEGDEYDTAFFDKTPKFLHYRPRLAIMTSVEFDHADIYADFDAVLKAFGDFVRIIPGDGQLVVNGDDSQCRALSKDCRGRVWVYGVATDADYRLTDIRYQAGGVRFSYRDPRGTTRDMLSKLPGRHNLFNTLAVIAVASEIGITPEQIQQALLSFQGVQRRQDVLGEIGGIVLIDDFAHHPTAVRETIEAIRHYYPNRRVWALFEPRSNSSRRKVFQEDYGKAFDHADLIVIKEPPDLGAIPAAERLDTQRLVTEIGDRGKDAHWFHDVEHILAFVLERSRAGDVVLIMSNGSFDGLPRRLLAALEERRLRS